MSAAVDALGEDEPLRLTLDRNGEEITVSLMPQYDEAEARRLIGVSVIAYARPTFGQAVGGAWESCVYASTAIAESLGRLIFQGEGAEDVSGPVGVVQIIAEQTRSGGLYMYLSLAVLISINLGDHQPAAHPGPGRQPVSVFAGGGYPPQAGKPAGGGHHSHDRLRAAVRVDDLIYIPRYRAVIRRLMYEG